jgi:hypothetical protein
MQIYKISCKLSVFSALFYKTSFSFALLRLFFIKSWMVSYQPLNLMVPLPSLGAGQQDEWRRSDFALLTGARNRHPKRFSGAGPHRKN